MSGVKSVPAQRRPNTETYVFCFDGTNNGKLIYMDANGLDVVVNFQGGQGILPKTTRGNVQCVS